jgi:signal transduction histidine kinase
MRSAQSVVIEIEDRGIGIDVADLDRIFEPFFRTDRSQMQSGSGIGLSLCRRIVEAHGGKISARSQADIGTVVSVELPVGVQSGSLQQRAPVE